MALQCTLLLLTAAVVGLTAATLEPTMLEPGDTQTFEKRTKVLKPNIIVFLVDDVRDQ